jgi:hypothetical protein
VCVEEVHKPKQGLGHAGGKPIDSEAKRTKRMSVNLGVEPKLSSGKTTKRK